MEKEILEKLGSNIRAERVRRRFTQEKLAELADCDISYIGIIERGIQNPSVIKLLKIAKALNVDIKVILDGLL